MYLVPILLLFKYFYLLKFSGIFTWCVCGRGEAMKQHVSLYDLHLRHILKKKQYIIDLGVTVI